MMDVFFEAVQSPAGIAMLLYFAAATLTGSLLALIDKRKAIKGAWRIPERTLMLCGLFGGAAGMYVTMRIIRHKTKHAKFMIGLPIEIIIQIALLVILFLKMK